MTINPTEINIAIALSGLMLCILGSVVLSVEKHIEAKTIRFFGLVLSVLAGYILVNFIGLVIGGKPSPVLHIVFQITVYLEFFFGYFLILLVSLYLFDSVGAEGGLRNFRNGLKLFFMLEIILLTISQFTGMYYTIGPDNVYRRNPDLYWISSALSLYVLLLDSVIYFTNLKKMSRELKTAFGFYLFFPFVGMILQIFFYDLHIPIFLAVFCTMVMFVFVLHDQAEKTILKEKENVEMRTSIMLSQIQPHFMFNSLGAIRELCHSDPEKAEAAIVRFSQYLRRNMDSIQSATPISFEEELKHTQNYLELEKLRFGDMLQVEYDIRTKDFRLPALSLQPITENAVRHGVRKSENGGTVWLRTRAEKNAWIIEVEDNGAGFDTNERPNDGKSHIGIDNVRNRIEQMCGGHMEIRSEQGKGTLARIIIPMEK